MIIIYSKASEMLSGVFGIDNHYRCFLLFIFIAKFLLYCRKYKLDRNSKRFKLEIKEFNLLVLNPNCPNNLFYSRKTIAKGLESGNSESEPFLFYQNTAINTSNIHQFCKFLFIFQ